MRYMVILLFLCAEIRANDVIRLVREFKYEQAESLLLRYSTKPDLHNHLNYFIKLHKGLGVGFDEKISLPNSDNEILRGLSLLNLGLYQFYKNGNEIEAFENLRQSLRVSEKAGNRILACESIKAILELYNNFDKPFQDESHHYFLKQYKKYIYDDLEENIYNYYNFRLTLRYNLFKKDVEDLYKIANRTNQVRESTLHNLELNLTNASYHYHIRKDPDSAYFYLDEILKVEGSLIGGRASRRFMAARMNKSRYLNDVGNPNEALRVINEVSLIDSIYLFEVAKTYYFFNKHKIFRNLNQLDSSLFYQNEYYKKENELNQYKSLRTISNLETKHQTAKKEKQILEEQQKVRTNRNWLIAAGLALLLGAGIAVLLQKNTTKKQQLAEKEAVLKQQRVENLLKEQELVSIDAMIAGQEKERQKVAGELHDDLGSLMATIKLHFDHAKVGKKDPALQNAQKLLEEAYQKIRGMAHSKNSGVMSDQGLLSAIKNMAKTITETNALEVTVEDFGLGERMENSLELSIFRMVQELVANAIKHAEASKVNIQLTQHEDNLNIIVEDNGKGFDRSKLDKNKSGIGLTNIEKRVEHLEGNFTVDSIVGKGTSILIDIPV